LLATEFPGSEQVVLVGLSAADDQAVWAHATVRGPVIVSKDADLERLSVAFGPPPKIKWRRVGNGPTRDVVALLPARATVVHAFLADPTAAVLELP